MALTRPLPAEDKLVLLPKNPGAFFAFWSFSAARAEAFRAGTLQPEVELRLSYADDKAHAGSRRISWEQLSAYLPVPAQGRVYEAAIYAQRGGAWERLLESNQASAPSAAGLADERAYASLEFHKRVAP